MRTPLTAAEPFAKKGMDPSDAKTVADAIELALCDLGCPSPQRRPDESPAAEQSTSVRRGHGYA